MEEIQYKMSNNDKFYLIGVSTLIVYILFRTSLK
jgi:hypothetical protein